MIMENVPYYISNYWHYVAIPVILIILIIAIREIVLWYYRVNTIVKLLESNDKSLKQIAFILSGKIRVKVEEENETTSS